jgi:hypothetical protein
MIERLDVLCHQERCSRDVPPGSAISKGKRRLFRLLGTLAHEAEAVSRLKNNTRGQAY